MIGWKKVVVGLGIGTVFAAGVYAGMSLRSAEAAPAENARVYELRTYHCNPGKLDALNERFANHTNRLFVKHGMTLVGYWTPIGEGSDDTLIYVIGHESREAARKNWSGFVNDPEWKKVAAESEKDGKILEGIESVYLTPTDYSPLR